MFPNGLICNFPCMGLSKKCESDEIVSRKRPREPVLLNVYDMYKINDYTSNLGLGIFHSGVEIYGIEFGYGGHPSHYSGIFEVEPRNEMALGEYFNLRGQLHYRQTILIGYTNLTCEEVFTIKNRLGRRFRGDKYHLINHNCNHFSGAFTKLLCKKDIPSWINRLAYFSSLVPFLQKCLPNEWLTPTGLEKVCNHYRQ